MPAHEPKAGKPAAKQGDKVVGIDTHVVMIPSPGGPVPSPTPLAFSGTLSGDLSRDVLIEGKAAAIQGSTAANAPAHVPPGSTFQRPPSNQARVRAGSKTVLINNKPAARLGDPAMTCDDLADAPNGSAIAAGRVLVAGRDPALLVGKELVVERVNADRPNVGDIHVDKESAVLRRKRPAIEEAENVERRQRFEPFAGRRVAWHDEEQLDRSGLVSTRRPHGRRAHLRGPRRARLFATLGAAPQHRRRPPSRRRWLHRTYRGGAFALAIVAAVHRRFARAAEAEDAREGRAVAVEGPCTKQLVVQRHGRILRSLRIGRRSFDVSHQGELFAAIVEGSIYRAYAAPRSGRLLAIEPTRVQLSFGSG